MTAQGQTNASRQERENTRQALKRRGLIAGAATLVAGMVALRAEQPVSAGFDGDVILGNSITPNTNLTANSTIITISSSSSQTGYSNGYGLIVNGADNLIGIRGYCPGTGAGVSGRTFTGQGVQGIALGNPGATGGYGVFGGSYNMNGIGVWGYGGGPNGTGVYGQADSYGVQGNSSNTFGAGVYGISSGQAGSGVYGTGFFGVFGSSSHTGVYGVANGANTSIGVSGTSDVGAGVSGSSNSAHGVVGFTSGTYFGGVFGSTTTPGATGIYGSTSNGSTNVATAYAGYFDGNFAVVHGFKSIAVPHPDNSYRLLYCMESPENWFEDFGKVKLVNGAAEVKLDADFAAIVHTDDYHVFLTEYDDNNNLYVTKQNASGFAVRAKNRAGASGLFSYRVVAKRKDITPERLAKIDLPKVKAALPRISTPPKLPEPLAPPKAPERSALL